MPLTSAHLPEKGGGVIGRERERGGEEKQREVRRDGEGRRKGKNGEKRRRWRAGVLYVCKT